MMDYQLVFINFLFPRLFAQQAKAAVISVMECVYHLEPAFSWHWLMLLNCTLYIVPKWHLQGYIAAKCGKPTGPR